MKIELNENSKEKLFNFIQNSYEIDVDFFKNVKRRNSNNKRTIK